MEYTEIYYLDKNNIEKIYNGNGLPFFLEKSYWNRQGSYNDDYSCKIHNKNNFAYKNKSLNNGGSTNYQWFINGLNHREDGYAYLSISDFSKKVLDKLFFLKGKCLNDRDFCQKTNHLICNKCLEFCKQQCFIN